MLLNPIQFLVLTLALKAKSLALAPSVKSLILTLASRVKSLVLTLALLTTLPINSKMTFSSQMMSLRLHRGSQTVPMPAEEAPAL